MSPIPTPSHHPDGYETREVDGVTMYVHTLEVCNARSRKRSGPFCPLHHPSAHPLAGARLFWRDDRRLWERICDHGVGHPDPDDLEFKYTHMDPEAYDNNAFDIHGCDGCCTRTTSVAGGRS